MDQSLSAQEWVLSKIFCSDYEFIIPDYQRPYRWGKDQVLQLLDDLEEALERGNEEPYFLGSLILVRQGGTRFDVIDGQQRLTTLTILFAVLRDLAQNEDVARALGNLVLEPGSVLAGIESKPRLALRKQDAGFFSTYVQHPGKIETLVSLLDTAALSEPQRAIRDNTAALYARLVDWDDERRTKLAMLMNSRTFLVVVKTADLDSAYRIFSVMNARGLDLAPADIFKSRVIGALPSEPDYAERWEDAEEALGSDDFTELFRDLRTVVSGERARAELLREFPAQVLDDFLDTGRAAEFVDEVVLPYAQAFECTVTGVVAPGKPGAGGSPEAWRSVNASLRRLGMLDNKDWRPVTLWALVEHANDPGFLDPFLRKLERLAAMLLLAGVYSTPRVLRYLALLKDLKAGYGLEAPALELSSEEKAAALAALDGEVYLLQAKRARYVMLRLDELLSAGSGVEWEHSIISIEHVLPQNPGQDSRWGAMFTEEERAYWTHRLGNLVLLSRRKNSRASNFDFAKKKTSYFLTPGVPLFAVTARVLAHDDWTPAIVEWNQTELVDYLAKEWELY